MYGMRKSPITNDRVFLAALLLVCSLLQISQGQNIPSTSSESPPTEEILPKPAEVQRLPDSIHRLPPLDGQPPIDPPPPIVRPRLIDRPQQESVVSEEYCPPGTLVYVGDPDAKPNGIPPSILEEALKALDLEASRPPLFEPNLGTERVIFAPFEIDVAYPQNVTSFRFDSAFRMKYPDRSEYFWKKVTGTYPKNPSGDQQNNDDGPELSTTPSKFRKGIDFQEVRVYSEHASGDSSAFIELPIRFVRAPGGSNSVGLANLQIGVKSLLSKGDGFFLIPTPSNSIDEWRLCGILTNHISLSPKLANRGLSPGYFSLEPGLLATYSMSRYTAFYNELKYWIPMGGTSDYVGNVLKWGMGAGHVIFFNSPEVDSRLHFAIIPTIELIGWNFRNGQETYLSEENSIKAIGKNDNDDTQTRLRPQDVNRMSVVNVQPGVRIPLGKNFEIGISSSWRLTKKHSVYDELYRIDFRWLR